MSYSWGSDTAAKFNGGGFDYGSAKKGYQEYDPDKAYVPKGSKGSVGSMPSQNMNSAYMLSTRVMDAALTAEEKNLLKGLSKNDIIVIPGSYDSVQKVLDASKTPHTTTSSNIRLDPKQMVLVNCPGSFMNFSYKGKSGVESLRDFVTDGGFVVSTDWALESVIMKAFPGYIKHSGKNTADDVVEVDLVAANSPYTKGLGGGALKPIWWLESSSYPIGMMRNKDVDVLLGSKEMQKKYGEMPIAVKFAFGNGRVVHVTSHFYLQTSKSKYEAQEKKTGLDFATKFLGMAKDDASQIDGIADVSFGALESAYTSLRFLHNVFIQKIKANNGQEEKLLASPEMMKMIGASKAVSVRKLPAKGTPSRKA